MSGRVYSLSDERFIAVDKGRSRDECVEVEFERLPDGTLYIHDIREIPKKGK